jgi:flagellar M-ring protein FliF
MTSESVVNAVSGISTTIEKAPLTPQKVRVSISIPDSYFANVWREQNKPADGSEAPAPPQAELEKVRATEIGEIEKSVANLLPDPPAGVDPIPRVTVRTFPAIGRPPLEEPSFAANAWAWTNQYGGTLVMVGLALFGFMSLRSIVRSTPAAASQAASTGPALAVIGETQEAQEPDPAAGPTAPKRSRKRLNKGPSLRDDLVEMVQEDPDAAAAILRNWISSAA